ncbi:Pectinesterase 1, partial [Cucurbita argyrosperma subsp. argyrosperma]
DCRIYARLLNNIVKVTAQSEESIQLQLSGFSFQDCTVIFMESFLNSVLNLTGWSEWSNSSSLKLLFYSEYVNRGLGANLSGGVKWPGVKWPGFHAIENRKKAIQFTVRQFINGTTWLLEIGIPYRPDRELTYTEESNGQDSMQ